MSHHQDPNQRLDFPFRVLIIGRANAGKTSILQGIGDTTESPIIYRGKEEVCVQPFVSAGPISLLTRLYLTRLWMLVANYISIVVS